MPVEPMRVPYIEWRWSELVIHSGSVTTKGQADELIRIVTYFAEQLPEGVATALARHAREKGNANAKEGD
jgi:hypothetical protein